MLFNTMLVRRQKPPLAFSQWGFDLAKVANKTFIDVVFNYI